MTALAVKPTPRMELSEIPGLKHIDAEDIAHLERLPTGCMPVLVEAMRLMNPDADTVGLECSVLASNSSLQGWLTGRERWAKKGDIRECILKGGYRAIVMIGISATGHADPRNFAIVDLGDIRAVLRDMT